MEESSGQSGDDQKIWSDVPEVVNGGRAPGDEGDLRVPCSSAVWVASRLSPRPQQKTALRLELVRLRLRTQRR